MGAKNIILILSEKKDASTWEVTNWLKKLNVNYLVITDEDIITDLTIRPDCSFHFFCKGIAISSDKIVSYWFRRGELNISSGNILDVTNKNNQTLNQHFHREKESLTSFLHFCLRRIPNNLANSFNATLNKMYVLHLAEKYGLLIPDSLITTSKKELSKFKSKNERIITKAISETFFLKIEEDSNMGMLYTEEIEDESIEKIPSSFFISKFQGLVDKKCELRIFFLRGEFYSMAIFSQLNQQTKIDFRQYDKINPNRRIPFKLPNDICAKLTKLMSHLKLQTGSIDMILTHKNEFVFLEVNPVGQFGMVSQPCNYQLERKIAETLIQKMN